MARAKPLPDHTGHFGPFGGKFVPETVMAALEELEQAYRRARRDPNFTRELRGLLQRYAGRPTPLYRAKLNFTSSVVSGSPLWNLSPGRSLNS